MKKKLSFAKTDVIGVIINIHISQLPDGIKEGSVIRYFDGKYELDIEEQKNIEDRIAEKMDSLWE